MDIENNFLKLGLSDTEDSSQNYQYINVFKNPNKLPINQIHLEKSWRELRKDLPKDVDILTSSAKDLEKAYFQKKTEIIPALDRRWLSKGTLPKFQTYFFSEDNEENISFLLKNVSYCEGLDYLLNCSYHQFWCVIFFEPSASIALRSFLLNPIIPFQVEYLDDSYLDLYKTIYNKFLLVYEKLLTFTQSEIEFMPESFGLSKLVDKKLLNLPIVITLALLYKKDNLAFVNKVNNLYFNDTSQMDFVIKEMETTIDQNLIILEMIGGHICGFDETAVIVPIAVEKRPSVFNLKWVYSVVSYLLTTLIASNALFHLCKPAVEIAFNKNFPFRLPFIYVTVYKQLYEYLEGRDEAHTQEQLFKRVLEEINLGRNEFVELYNIFISHCLDEALRYNGDSAKQELVVENYLKLLTTALEDDYFICDYNAAYNVATQNEMFQSCCDIDPTRTQFIVSCINKLARNKKLEQLSKLKRQTIESVFRDAAPVSIEPVEEFDAQPGSSREVNGHNGSDVEESIRNIIDMFPHLGDGFILQCLEAYNFNSADVINAILENNLPPHLTEIPFDNIRIPPEPEPEKPKLAYIGKKPQYDDALKLLNDKKEKSEIKNLVLEGIQYGYDNMYDDEYDDRFDSDVEIPVPDNPLTEEVCNPNRKSRFNESESEEEEDKPDDEQPTNRNKLNFCEDPALLRERREARFRSKQPQSSGRPSTVKPDVVGKPKGQGQDKSTVINRQKKNTNKASRANHNRKGGAQFKRNKGMIPS